MSGLQMFLPQENYRATQSMTKLGILKLIGIFIKILFPNSNAIYFTSTLLQRVLVNREDRAFSHVVVLEWKARWTGNSDFKKW
jgi:hypothetical protein